MKRGAGRRRGSKRLSSMLPANRLPAAEVKTVAIEEPESKLMFEVFPKVLNFEDIHLGSDFVLTVKIKNKDTRTQRINLRPPATKYFHIDIHDASRKIAPGLSVTVDVTFRAPERGGIETLREVHDHLLLYTEQDKVTIPLHAFPPRAIITFDKFLRLGTNLVGNNVARFVTFSNSGSRAGFFRIDAGKNESVSGKMQIEPSQGVIKPGENRKVRVSFTGSETGPFHRTHYVYTGTGTVVPARPAGVADASGDKPQAAAGDAVEQRPRPAGKTGLPEVLDVTCNVVEQSLQLVMPEQGGLVEELQFGRMYFGQQRVVKAQLLNNSPVACNFDIKLVVPAEALSERKAAFIKACQGRKLSAASITDPISKLEEPESTGDGREIKARPSQGNLAPYSKLDVCFIFTPTNPFPPPAFKSQLFHEAVTLPYKANILIEILNAPDKTLEIPLSGLAVDPSLSVSKQEFHFGDCPVHERRDMQFVVTNNCADLPISFSVEKRAHFAVKPSKGRLAPLQSKAVVVSFLPRHLGTFDCTVHVLGERGVNPIPLLLCGSANVLGKQKPIKGGPQRMAADFKPKLNFVEDQPALTRQQRKNLLGTRREMPYHGLYRVVPGVVDHYTYSEEERKRRSEHKKAYNKFLATKRRTRHKHTIAKGSVPELIKAAATHKNSVRLLRTTHGLKDMLNPDPMDEVNLGLEFASGLASPRPDLPPPAEELALMQPVSGFGGIATRAGGGFTSGPTHEPDRLISRKFKPSPSTQAEHMDCESELTPELISKISAGPKSIDFGHVCVGSRSVKNFSIINGTDQFIIVELQLDAEEVKQTTPKNQVVPPGKTAGFDVVLLPTTKLNEYRYTIPYSINKKHAFTFQVQAEVGNKSLEVSHSELLMSFASDSPSFSVTKHITLSNPFTAPIDFWWGHVSDSFSVSPQKGTVGPKKKQSVAIEYKPTSAQPKREEDLQLNIKGGDQKNVRLIARNPEAQVHFRSKVVDFGQVCVGTTHRQVVSLQNNGKVRTVFKSAALAAGISVQPQSGVLDAHRSVDITITVRAAAPTSYNNVVSFEYRGQAAKSKPVSVLVKGEAIVPKVALHEDELKMGSVIIGACSKRTLTLENTSTIEATLVLDLSAHPEFSLRYRASPLPGDTANAGQLNVVPVSADNTTGVTLEAPYRRKTTVRVKDTNGSDYGADDDKEVAWKITMAPKSTQVAHLVFAPTSIGKHSFLLPLHLRGVPGFASLRRLVTAVSTKPVIAIQPHTVDLGKKVVLLKDRAFKRPYTDQLVITNLEGSTVSFRLALRDHGMDEDTQDETSSVGSTVSAATSVLSFSKADALTWRMEPMAGMLLPQQSVTVNIQFAPTDALQYRRFLAVFLDESSAAVGGDSELQLPSSTPTRHRTSHSDRPYLTIPLTGTAVFPSLAFDVSEVVLPPVPLGVTSSTTFYVRNKGYEHLQLEYALPKDSSRVPLQLSFTDGSTLGTKVDRVGVRVAFKYDRPMSFTVTVDFLDSAGHRFPIPVTGSTDNSLLTVQPYLDTHSEFYRYEKRSGHGVQLIPTTKALRHGPIGDEEEKGTAPVRKTVDPDADDDDDDDNDDESAPLTSEQRVVDLQIQSMHHLVSFLGASRLLPMQTMHEIHNSIDSFGEVLAKGGSGLLCSLTEFVSGKRINKSGKKKKKKEKAGRSSRASAKSVEPSSTSYTTAVQQYGRVLTFLKTHGALINHVKPEHFLPVEQYRQLLDYRQQQSIAFSNTSKAEATQRHRELMRAFPAANRQAWLSAFSQIVKVFILNRVTPRAFKSLPGTPASAATAALTHVTGSNVFSVAEGILMQWLNYHNMRVHGDAAEPINNFEWDLADGVALCAVVQCHAPQVGYIFERMHSAPSAYGEYIDNAHLVLEAIDTLGLQYPMSPEHIASPHGQDLMLFVLFLFQTLPDFIPKTTIEFEGKLHEEVTKVIELANPSKLDITYNVGITGSTDFEVHRTTLQLAPKGKPGSKVPFPIKFKGRFSKSVTATLTFTADEQSPHNAATLVFNLRSNIIERQASQTFKVETECYNQKKIILELKNPFNKECVFEVSSKETKPSVAQIRQRLRAVTGMGRRASAVVTDQTADGGPQPQLPNSFWLTHDRIKMKPLGVRRVELAFIPFQMGKHTCQYVFLDETAGEFMVEGVGVGLAPQPIQKLTWKGSENAVLTESIELMCENPLMEKARQTVKELIKALPRSKKSQALSQWEAADIAPKHLPPTILYTVTPSSQYFSVPSMAKVPQNVKGRKDKKGSIVSRSAEKSVILPATLDPKGAGTYSCDLLLESLLDVRRYTVHCKIASRQVASAIEFNAGANERLEQGIPVVNNTTETWTIKAVLTGKYFSGPPELTVPAGATREYPLVFQPTWVCEERGRLVLTNARNGDVVEYELTGVGEEPLAEDDIVVECVARETVERSVVVPNTLSQERKFTVESDLPGVSGDPSIVVRSNSRKEYTFQVTPQRAGQYSGSITFLDADGKFVWYSVQVVAQRPPPEQTLNIKTHLRKAVVVQVNISNPLDREVTFDVDLQGDGLIGDSTFSLGPLESNTYEMVYSPLTAVDCLKGSVAFSNEEVGEFWYELRLTAERAPAIQLSPMQTPVGLTSRQEAVIQNPTEQELVLHARSSSDAFAVDPPVLVVPPLDELVFDVLHIPSSVDVEEQGDLRFVHPSVGEIHYTVSGTGLRPGKLDVQQIVSPVNTSTSATIQFKNPFHEALRVNVRLEDDTKQFSLFSSQSVFVVAPLATLTLPVSFRPNYMVSTTAAVSITQLDSEHKEDPLVWTFPLLGIAEGPTSSEVLELACTARRRLKKTLPLVLPGLLIGPNEEEEFKAEVLSTSPEQADLVESSLRVSLPNNVLHDAQEPLTVELLFHPLRSFSAGAHLVISKRSGGRWTFNLRCKVAVPPPDDVIVVEAPIHHTAAVRFQLRNQFDEEARFTASFLPGSAPEFAVFPTKGTLAAYSSAQGTTFEVSFSPEEYGSVLNAKLIVKTADMEWVYELRGRQPKYVPPTIDYTSIDNKLPADVIKRAAEAKERTQKIDRVALNKQLAASYRKPRTRTRNKPRARK